MLSLEKYKMEGKKFYMQYMFDFLYSYIIRGVFLGNSAQCNGTGCVVPVHLFVHQFSNAPHRQIDRAAVKQGVYGIAVGVSEGLTDIVHQNGNVRPDGSLNRLCLGCRIRGSRH